MRERYRQTIVVVVVVVVLRFCLLKFQSNCDGECLFGVYKMLK